MEYGINYYYNMIRMYSSTAERIARIRWEFVKDLEAKYVLDYGSGCGFFKSFCPSETMVDTYDIMPVPITGITRKRYDLVTFWDVLEHIPDFNEILGILEMTRYVAITVPVKPSSLKWDEYKHYKPLEHIHHFDDLSLCALMASFRYKLRKAGYPECPPREHIKSYIFENLFPPGESDHNAKADLGKPSRARGHIDVNERDKGSS